MPSASSRRSSQRIPEPGFSRVQDVKDRIEKPVSGRDVVDALANSPLKDVPIERLSVKVRAREVKL